MAVHHRVHGLTLSGTTGVTTRCTKGGCTAFAVMILGVLAVQWGEVTVSRIAALTRIDSALDWLGMRI